MKRATLAGFLWSAVLFAQAQPTWITVRDKMEDAFSIDVPQGWKVIGGMYRFRLLNPRPFVDMTSPDGLINMRIGDPAIPNYNTPGPMHPPGPAVAAYASGDLYATKYGQTRFAEMCDNVQVTQSASNAPVYNKSFGPVRVTAGWSIFSCSRKGRPMSGFVYAETKLVPGPLESNWYVVMLTSMLAPTPIGQTVGAWLKRSGQSMVYNPEWLKAEGQRIQDATRFLQAIAANNKRQGEIDRAHFQKQMDMMKHETDYAQDVISGVTYTRDPWTGQTRDVYTGSGANKWISAHTGTVIDSTLSPGPSYHQLETPARP